jgi:hypothetical protein
MPVGLLCKDTMLIKRLPAIKGRIIFNHKIYCALPNPFHPVKVYAVIKY